MPIDPTMSVSGADWSIQGAKGLTDADGTDARAAEGSGGGFGDMLSKSISSLDASQQDAASASQAFAAGTVTDPTSVVMAVERARMTMQLASQIRTKAVEAYTDIFHTQV